MKSTQTMQISEASHAARLHTQILRRGNRRRGPMSLHLFAATFTPKGHTEKTSATPGRAATERWHLSSPELLVMLWEVQARVAKLITHPNIFSAGSLSPWAGEVTSRFSRRLSPGRSDGCGDVRSRDEWWAVDLLLPFFFLTQHLLNSDPWSRCRAAFTGQEYPECELHGGSDLCLKRADSCRKWRIVPGRSSAALVAALLTPGWWVRQEGAKWNSATPGMPIPSCRTQCKHLLLRNPRQKLIHPNVILDRVVQLQPREMWSFVLHLVRFESAGSYC